MSKLMFLLGVIAMFIAFVSSQDASKLYGTVPFYSGRSTLFFDANVDVSYGDHSNQAVTKFFVMPTDFKETIMSSTVVSIVGYEGMNGNDECVIQVRAEQSRGQRLTISASSYMSVSAVQISYLIFDSYFGAKVGFYSWERPKQQESKNPVILSKEKSVQLKQTVVYSCQKEGQTFLLGEYHFDLPFCMAQLGLKVMPMLTTLMLSQSSSINQIEASFDIEKGMIEVKNTYLQRVDSFSWKSGYFLLLKIVHSSDEFSSLKFQTMTMRVQNEKELKMKSSQEIVLMGLSRVSGPCQTGRQNLFFQDKVKGWIHAGDRREGCVGEASYSLLRRQTGELAKVEEQQFARRYLLTCTGATYSSTWNWTAISLRTTGPSGGSTTACMPCPIGCLTCTAWTAGSPCYNVTCTACNTANGFTMENEPCSNKACKCPSGKWPNVTTGTCQVCATVIPGCASCNTIYNYGGTYCTSCSPGYYKQSGSYPRQCYSCATGCKTCSSGTVCSACNTGFILVSSVCQCNTTQLLYYNAGTGTCTTCVSAYANCVSCTGSVLVTTCTGCTNPGFFLNTTTGTCQACGTYCSACTAVACTTCTSSTLIPSGSTCACNATAQMFVNASSSSCAACSTFQPHCATCVANGTGVSCSVCSGGYFPVSGVCTACIAYCNTCTDTTSCSTCTGNFIFNGTSCACNSTADYIYSGGTCVLCTLLIPNCDTCVTSPSLTCALCKAPFYNATPTATSCTACPLVCTSCTDPATCTGCQTGYNLTAGVCTCLDCVNCSSFYGASCTTCNGSVCLSCEVGLYLAANYSCTTCPNGCSVCSSAVTCTACSSPFVLSAPNCVCNTALLSYYDPNTMSCSSCATIYGPNCTACSGGVYASACTACSVGTYLSNPTTCSVCPLTCTACTSPSGVCTACLPTFIVISGACACDTGSQYFLDTTSGTCQTCSALIPECSHCEVNNLSAIDVGCTLCLSGYYIDASYACTVCPVTCKTCSSAAVCLSCVATFSLINNTCVCDQSQQLYNAGGYCAACYTFVSSCQECAVLNGTVICQSCPVDSYLSADNMSCILCPTNCDNCSSGGCITCSLGFVSVVGVCTYTDTCSAYTGMDPNCAYCGLANQTTSTTNATTNVTTNTTIVVAECMACLSGYYLSNQNMCIGCAPSCATCSGYTNCTTCQPTFTLVNTICECDAYSNLVLQGSSCVSCSSIIPNCATCNGTIAPVSCVACLSTYVLNGTACTSCPTGCTACLVNGSCSSCIAGYTYSSTAKTCTNTAGCTSAMYYSGGSCWSCVSPCSTCLSATVCLTCAATFILVNGECVCDNTHGMFASTQNSICNQCGNFLSGLYGNYTANCLICSPGTVAGTSGFGCTVCATGYYLVGGSCSICQPGCDKCSGPSSCYQCQSPVYEYQNGSCVCDEANNYFLNASVCQLCNLTNCSICISLVACEFCTMDNFVNSTTHQCQPQICGNDRWQGTQQCDDGNFVNGDGCSNACQIEIYYLCNGVPGYPSVCVLQNNNFRLMMVEQVYSCNQIEIKLQNVGSQSVAQCDLTGLLQTYNINNTKLESYSSSGNFITYTFLLTASIQGQLLQLQFDPSVLCVANSNAFPPFNITTTVNPTNNKPAVFYNSSQCTAQKSTQALVSAVQYASYATLFLSALPCKIVGLQLFGVLQLAYLTLGSMDNVNLMLYPLLSMAGVNGYHLDLGGDQSKSRLLQSYTPERINSIDYKANFIRNCNVMLLVVAAIIVISFFLYLATYICKNCSPTFHKIAKRLIKEVLLTFILFNELNFAYCAGIHFKYAPTNDSLYFQGTLAAAAALIIPVVMAIALMCSEQQGFGQFKDKLKSGCVQRAYFVVTICYRMLIGLYMSSANEDQLSTLILLAISIMFLLYNLVNLPFTKAYHNYRANICHFAQFVTLFVAMFYRSMMSNNSLSTSAYIFSPVYVEYIFIAASVVVSLIVLMYEIYLFVKDCCYGQKKDEVLSNDSQGKIGKKVVPNLTVEDLSKNEQKIIFEDRKQEWNQYDF